jgi:DNA-binding CsgD family transcriptional regulator
MAGWRFALSEPDENSRGAVLLVICTCYFVFVLVAPVIQSWLDIRDKNTGDTRSDGVGAEEYSERCSTISKEYGLSARESEVLYYVGRGYNASYIAKALYISDSTARTHLNNIYHKLDITSRMQAIEMFEGVYDREIIE